MVYLEMLQGHVLAVHDLAEKLRARTERRKPEVM